MAVEMKDPVVAKLINENDEFKKLQDEHAQLESELEELSQKKFLSVEEDLRFKELKKMKLAGKDRMTQILSQAKSAE